MKGFLKLGRLSDLDIAIDDTPIQTVTEMRAKAKRLQKERGLDFIVVDYMQLIYGVEDLTKIIGLKK